DADRAGVALEVVGAGGGAVVADRVVEAGRAVVVGGRRVGDGAGGQADRSEGRRGGRERGHRQRLRALVGRAGHVVAAQARCREAQRAVLGDRAADVVAAHRRVVALGDRDADRAGVALEVVGAGGGAVVSDRVVEAGRAVVVGGRRVGDGAGGQVDGAVGVRGRGDRAEGRRVGDVGGRGGRGVDGQGCGREAERAVLGDRAADVVACHRRIVDLCVGDRNASGVSQGLEFSGGLVRSSDRVVEAGRAVVVGGRRVGDGAGGQVDGAVGVRGRGD